MDAAAQTAVSGAIKVNMHWTAAGGPYLLSGDVLIQDGAVLAIDAGTEIYMGADASLTVQSGSVQARGTAALPVLVRSDKSRNGLVAAPGDYRAWTFSPGSVDTQLEHVRFEYGSGLVARGSAPVFNYLDIRNNRGAAISIDLAASPAGVGNQASGNGLNGIAVPAGDIVASVNWGLRGIPYVVETGTVSVGRSPGVTTITPAAIEQGQTATVAVEGVLLDGLAAASFDSNGLAVTPFSGGSSTRQNFQVKAAADAKLGPTTLRLQLDAGELVLPGMFSVTQPMPAITAIVPSTVLAGTGATGIVVTGRNFTVQSEVLVNSAAIPGEFVSDTELHASLPNQTVAASLPLQVRTPDAVNNGGYVLSNPTTLTVQMPVPPVVSFEPTPIAMPPDGKPHDITLRLSKADFRDHTIEFSVSDATKASVSPASLTIVAGQTSARVTVTPLAQGSVTLQAHSATLGDSSVPMFITPDFRGLNTSYALPVGVMVEGGSLGTEAEVVVQGVVGVGVGAVLDDLAPAAWTVGSTQAFEIRGAGIPQGSQVAIVPADGVSVGVVVVSTDGKMLSVPVTATGDAAPGARRVVVRDNNGALLTFADAAKATVLLAAGLPRIDSISPLQVTRDSAVTLTVRGRNLQHAHLELAPGEGIEVDAQPRITADGTELIANLRVGAAVPLGAKVVRVTTAAGSSSAMAAGENTMTVVGTEPVAYSSTSPVVGVVVGRATPVPDPQVIAPILTSQIGVVVGATVTGVVPHVGIIGSTISVTVRGQGLQGVTSTAMVPAEGLVVGTPVVNADGTELSFSLQVDSAAAIGLRRLVLDTANGPLAFANVMDGAFLVSAPLPVIESATPLVLTLGGTAQNLVLRGRYLDNVSDVRFVPADGITVNRPFVASGDGRSLGVAVLVDAAAAPGPRTLIVTTAAGDSSNEGVPGNTVTLASALGNTYPAIVSGTVGVLVGAGPGPASYDGILTAPLVGVLIPEEVPAPISADTQAMATPVRVLVGALANDMTTDGWLQGATGTLTVHGIALGDVTSVTASPSTGVLFDAPSVNLQGTELSVPISVAQDAALGARQLHLRSATGEVAWARVDSSAFGIGRVPSMDSVTPIVLTAGDTTTLAIRGHDLSSVTGAVLLPGDGAQLVGKPQWSQDSLGELLTVTVKLDAAATPGTRVLQLLVPGGATSATSSAVNTLTVVPRQ
ncbi:hypothetical protein RHOFW104T7_15385 [Rhodanobacter thiooxydans]|uniref:IPT/TIG domain-containing protein n=1 Tax=Rhodanobacter thiooxydans TaxID=416169 RepID=A0A154QGJ4_9GAMM|nr:IPT/TIG domain-containing protein [Rhodanobacter thiooxydans]EIL98071.1 hypothetical protein UUA_12875 [Rhodanobacter thiooxydans LCS2]KZC23087.1 hypothetical protein RHOFW104T7_15385 [Rhodanobacter thiooxydans]MCW0203600.1 IPT/TIG domain-containing protein [Rhodanobacter thiooxydans]